MSENERLKLAIISGASHAMRFKEKNPNATELQVIKYVTENTDEILSKLENRDD